MKQKHSRLKALPLLMTALLLLAAVAACNSDAPATTTVASGAAVATETTPAETAAAPATAGGNKVYLITMDQMDQYWANIDAGCKLAIEELSAGGTEIEYIWQAPDVKDDAKQIEVINNAAAAGASVILLAANGPDAVTSALQEAANLGVKFIYVDSPADFPAEQTLTTDNEAAGKTAGETMLAALTAKGITSGTIGVVNVNSSTASVVSRETGFRAAFEGKGFDILETQYAEGDVARSKDAATNFITQGVVGLFGANEGSSTGVGNAIKEDGNKVIGVGFDNSSAIQELIADGSLLATMQQNPDKMGYFGMLSAAKILKGESIPAAEKDIDTAVSVLKAEGGATASGGASSGASGKVYLITMDQMDQYWANIDAGCKLALEELAAAGSAIEYIWQAPDVKDDAKQIEVINNAAAAGANVILLAANGPDAVTSALQEAANLGVKFIYVDSPADFPAEQTLTTDNEAAGKTAGETMLAALTAKGITSGTIGVVNVNSSTASVVSRETGFRAAFDGKGFDILETQYAEGDVARSKDAATNFITQGVVGLFGANEGSSTGVGNAIKEDGNKVIGVGFDNSSAIQELIADGSLLATMQQNPDKMGYFGMLSAAKILKGESIPAAEKDIDTAVSVLTK
jgi:ribose transport system substrate-binding protein